MNEFKIDMRKPEEADPAEGVKCTWKMSHNFLLQLYMVTPTDFPVEVTKTMYYYFTVLYRSQTTLLSTCFIDTAVHSTDIIMWS
jgi:hypothetical protein